MFKALTMTTLLFATYANSAEVDLQKVETVTDGFCVMDVFDLNQGKDRQNRESDRLTDDGRDFLKAALARAKVIYKTRSGYDEDFGIHVEKAEVVYAKNKNNPERHVQGSVIIIDQEADEDKVTFYFVRAHDGKAKLKLALHDEQSASAYWVCE